jgi:hypothetical protein
VRERLGAPAGRGQWILLLLPLALSAFTLRTITANYFDLDDFPNLFQIADDHPLAYLLTPYLGHVLVARNAVFYLMFQLFATDAAAYFWSALLTHLVNVWLAFLVVRELTGNPRLAAFGATMWGTSPLHEGSLGWYSAYGHLLVATALLIILLQAARAVARGQRVTRAQVTLWYALALVAATSFGNGLAVAVALPFALLCFLTPELRPEGARLPLGSLLVVVPALYFGLMAFYIHGLGRPAFLALDLGLVLSAWRAIPLFAVRLLSLGTIRLLFGPYFPTWMASPGVWYLATALGAAGCLWAARRSAEIRRPLAGCALLLLATYGSIAVGRAVFFAPMPIDALLALSRYHYVGQLLLMLAICLALQRAVEAISAAAQRAALGAWCVATLALYVCCAADLDHHDAARADVERELAVIRAAISAQAPGEVVRIDNTNSTLYPFWNHFPGRAALFVIFYPDNTVDGRRVYFVEPNPVRLRQAPRGRRTGTLFVAK